MRRDAALVDACATLASFNAVVKIADGTGIPLEEAKEIAPARSARTWRSTIS